MINPHKLLGTFASLGLLLGIATTAAAMEMPAESTPRGTFQKIEQPLSTKAAVIAGGLTLIGLELWWFLLSKPKTPRRDV
ncbi:MAG: hypothetical protein VKJ46_08215 [Leptolyngbyaceae bacterium]|nr:hypothetical protein [Leptolyngbyaceae bacterium]